MKDSIAILWDIENVTPSADSSFVRGLIEYASEIGQISVATAYGDWTKREIQKTALSLSENSFELIHVPSSKKNSTDLTLTTDAIELIHLYKHITRVILVAGDSDFRPLLLKLRKNGIRTYIICDAKSASEDLLLLADDYKDYRDLITDDEEDDDLSGESHDDTSLTFDDAAELVIEALNYLKNEKKKTSLGAVKIRVKLLNSYFDERKLGYSGWKRFIMAVANKNLITIQQSNRDMILNPLEEKIDDRKRLPFILYHLIKNINILNKDFGDDWLEYSVISQGMKDHHIDMRRHGYYKFKQLIQAAEKRNLVQCTNKDSTWYAKLSLTSKKFFT